jgi:hypothetical protein
LTPVSIPIPSFEVVTEGVCVVKIVVEVAAGTTVTVTCDVLTVPFNDN